MNEDQLDACIGQLSLPYAVALRLHRLGVEDAVIAKTLAIDASAVHSLLSMAEAKLNTVLGAACREVE